MRKILLPLLFAIVNTAHAQTVTLTSESYKGYINNINYDGNATLKIGEQSFLLATTKFDKDDAVLTLLDTKYTTLWQSQEIENYIAACLFNENILVISAENTKGRANLKTLTATLLDKKTGQPITEKHIDVYSDQTGTVTSLLTNNEGNFTALLLRSTNQKRPSGMFTSFDADLDFAKTNNLQVVTFNKDLDAQKQNISVPDLTEAQFIASAADENAVYFSYILSNNVVVKKYNIRASKIEGDIKAPINFDNDVKPITKTFLVIKNNTAFISGKLDEKRNKRSTFIIGSFNFNTNKGNIIQELEDKSYLKDADAKGKSFECINTFVYEDKFIVVKEAHRFVSGSYNGVTNTSSSSYYDYGPLLVSVYDNKMNKLKDFITDEEERIYYNVPSGGATLNGNKLYVFYNNNNWKIKSHSKYQVIDLDNLSANAETEIALDHNLNSLMYAPCILWYGNAAIIPLTGNAHNLGGKIQTSFATVEFK